MGGGEDGSTAEGDGGGGDEGGLEEMRRHFGEKNGDDLLKGKRMA